jgi:hypothetical protein
MTQTGGYYLEPHLTRTAVRTHVHFFNVGPLVPVLPEGEPKGSPSEFGVSRMQSVARRCLNASKMRVRVLIYCSTVYPR